jgi:hypothetical protein
MHGALDFLITETFKVKCLNRVTTKRDSFAESQVPTYGRRQDSAFQDEQERLLVSAQGGTGRPLHTFFGEILLQIDVTIHGYN